MKTRAIESTLKTCIAASLPRHFREITCARRHSIYDEVALSALEANADLVHSNLHKDAASCADVIFGKWRIGGTILASLLFGAATDLQFQLPALGVNIPNALLIMLPYVLALLAVGGLVGRQMAPAALGEPYRR